MTPSQKFRASYLKLSRASIHLDELRSAVASYISADPLDFCWESVPWIEKYAGIHAPDAHLIGLVPRVRVAIPETFAPIIGDVVHNLRSALDIMMFDLISESVPEDRRRSISFPFWRSETGRAKAMQYVELKPEVSSLVKAWEPYPGGRSRLHVLHDMWNTDKHRSIIPTMGGVEFSQVGAMMNHCLNGDQKMVDPFPARKQVRDGQPYIVMPRGDEEPPVGTKVPCVFSLALDGDEELKGRDLVGELEAHRNVVRCVLESFETGEAPTFVQPPPPGPVRVGPGQYMFPPDMSPDEVEKWLSENWGTLE